VPLLPFPTRGTLRRPRWRPADLVVAAGVLALLYGLLRFGQAARAPLAPGVTAGRVSTDPALLPGYALRSLARMFVALGCSVAFTLVYAPVAARSRRAEKVLIPALDILQSVPVLGFLAVTVTAFLRLFPGSMLGLEAASIFAIFTSQVWNLTFSFYHSLLTQPRPLVEAARMMRLNRWQRFWRLDVPGAMIPLVWNGMMSFGGGWFFLTASEAITVGGRSFALPGIGSYVASASDRGELGRVGLAIVVMVLLVVGVNVVFWRPLVAWSERFRMEETEATEVPRSVVLDLLRRSRVPRLAARAWRPVGEAMARTMRVLGAPRPPSAPGAQSRRRAGDVVFGLVVGVAALGGAYEAVRYVAHTAGLGAFGEAFGLGALTFARVAAVVVASTLVWVPVGVRIGLSPRLARVAQPVVQVLASFPANFLFPLVAAVLVATGVSLDWGGIVLMALGAQWYVLFNAIAGAMAIPSDLREAMASLGVSGWLRWRRLILPAIFPAYVTGGITASGGAWNASIVAEVVTYGGTVLTATGLGAAIAESTAEGASGRTLAGIIVMCVYVVALNRLVWRRLYRHAEQRFSL
jgi:NitT/TauT family transport system permease protein